MTAEPLIEVETVAGRLLVPAADRWITPALREHGVWEAAETRFLLATLRPGQTVVDVGAHVGYFTVLASRIVGADGAVIAVEPEERNLRLLRANLERNGCANVSVLPVAAAAAAGELSLAVDDRNRGGHRLVPFGEAATTVRCVRLDEVLPQRVDLVKIDAQGYDHEVIAGLEQTLARNPEAIVIAELSLSELARRGIEPASVLEGYGTWGFTISTCTGRGGLRHAPAGVLLADARSGRLPSELALVLRRVPAEARSVADAGPRATAGLVTTELPDGLLVSEPGHGRVHTLNATAALVFDLCTGENSVEQIAELVRRAFALSEAPRTEVDECLAHLRREGLVR